MDIYIKNEIISGRYKADKVELFGITHFKYNDCNNEDLVYLSEDAIVHKKCADAFYKMQEDAKQSGIKLEIISGFRSQKEQIEVFSRKFKDKTAPTDEEMNARLMFSAPSGFSEHHTGLAIDINSLEQDFEQDSAYTWLCSNAHNYGFEMSFPKNNKQHLGFEPWHWRYVGDVSSKKIFEQAREFV